MKSQVALTEWSELSSIKCLSLRKMSHYGLGPILENEGTIDDTYRIINLVFIKQLKYNHEKNFNGWLYLIYDDQKTVSLIHTVQKEQKKKALSYNRYD